MNLLIQIVDWALSVPYLVPALLGFLIVFLLAGWSIMVSIPYPDWDCDNEESSDDT